MNSTAPSGPSWTTIKLHTSAMQPMLPTYLLLLASSVFPIFTAAHASLRRPVNARSAPSSRSKSHKSTEDDVSEDESESQTPSPLETLSTSDAVLVPIVLGVTLSTLYLIIKWLEDPALLNRILGTYFNWAGILFSFLFVRDTLNVLSNVVFPGQYSSGDLIFRPSLDDARYEARDHKTNAVVTRSSPLPGLFSHIPLPTRLGKSIWSLRRLLTQRMSLVITTRSPLPTIHDRSTISFIDLTSLLLSIILALYQTYTPASTRPWLLTNLVGTSFCHGNLQFISTGTARVGTLLLSLLFCYDVYMVFFTPMMVTVATKLDVPIKLLFPKPEDAAGRAMAMLGLGDVVVPGIIAGWALRLDLWNYYRGVSERTTTPEIKLNGETKQRQDEEKDQDSRPVYRSSRGSWGDRLFTTRRLYSTALKAKDFPKPYFWSVLAGYVLGMVVTLVVMQVWQHAQPALLYLVPGVLGGLWGCAAVKGEVRMLWSEYDEGEEEKVGKDGKDGKEGKEGGKDEGEEEKTKQDQQLSGEDGGSGDAPKKVLPVLELVLTPVSRRKR